MSFRHESFMSFCKKITHYTNKNFFVGYSPERVNPGDPKHSIEKVSKILAIKTKSSRVKNRFLEVYKKISKKIVLTNSIENAETAKVIENIQRDLNIALIKLICKYLYFA